MKKNYFVGIDVSKHTLDVAFIVQQDTERATPCWKVFDNDDQGLWAMKTWLQNNHVPLQGDTLFVIENTGLYHRRLVNFCNKHQLQLCIENGAQVKWSLGIARGKSDKVDSRRLATYAVRFADRLKPAAALHEGIQAIKDLITLRNRHIVQLSSLRTHLKELKATTQIKSVKELEKIHLPLIEAMKAVIKKIEAAIIKKIQAKELTKKQYRLLLSIPCIGPVTASYLIACTNAFTLCSSGKQLACYCGVVPFEYQSGISIKGKHHVHKMANKHLKSLLHLCAMSAIKYVQEIKDYFNRKVEEGKHKMSVINAIRNKLVLRVFAVIKNDTPFVENKCIDA
ncbi:MAG: IS110 family transposase [Proteobacteria bacterium]|nr:IS110 family transposase [Pseudomonadota bacterium]MBS1920613.1 IS110 family transposase [Bacteroidota bacterium]